MTSLNRKVSGLRNMLAELSPVVIAFSGGVDSSYLLMMAKDTLGKGVKAVTEDSELITRDELRSAVELAAELDVPHTVVKTESLKDPAFTANPPDRCYLCKKTLYSTLRPHTDTAATIIDGTNHDDLADYRPGIRAADELGVRHPLAENRLSKDEIRAASRVLGLRTWDKESTPCLATRFAHGLRINGSDLRMIEKGESFIRALGFRNVRIRIIGPRETKIEVARNQVPELFTHRAAVYERLERLGFSGIAISREGYRQGSMNPVGKAGL